DGLKDHAVADAVAGGAWILFGDGKGGFAVNQGIFTGGQTQHIAAGDFNGDGHVDLATSNIDSNTIAILFNDGEGEFAAPVSYNEGLFRPGDVKVGDLDGDGNLDIIVVNEFGHDFTVFFNNGIGQFDVTQSAGTSGPRVIHI